MKELTEAEIVEKAFTVEVMLGSAGWAVVDELLKSYKDASVADLLDYRGADPDVLRARHYAARYAKEFADKLLQDLISLIEMAKEIKEENR